jgi:integrase
MSIKLATHLYRNRHGTFYFRLVIPRDLRSQSQQSEIRFSLHTEQRDKAIIRAFPLIAELPALISDLRQMTDDETVPAAERIKILLEEKRDDIKAQEQIEDLQNQLAAAHRQLALSVPRTNAERVVKAGYDKGQLKGKRELEDKLVFPWLPERTVHFSELKAAYLKSLTNRPDGARKKPPSENTLREYGRALELFITVMGDCRIGGIDRQVVEDYFSILKRLPSHMNVKAKYRDKTIPELLAMNDPPQEESTISLKIERISFMFKWALDEKRKWGIDANPFMGFGQAESEKPTRRPFTRDELLAILQHPDFLNRSFTNSYAFWLIPLATYTGARLGELAQLDLKDFVKVDGVDCIDINDIDAVEIVEGEGGKKKRVKNRNAKRLVPIHSELVRIGVLRHVERLRMTDQQQLFPELSRKRRGGAADAASKWFGRAKNTVGIIVKQEAVFHSFRHLFITNILDSGVAEHMLAPIVGHETKLITGQVYWNKKDATKRLPTVETFALPDDLRELFPSIEDVTFTPRRGPHPGHRRTTVS